MRMIFVPAVGAPRVDPRGDSGRLCVVPKSSSDFVTT